MKTKIAINGFGRIGRNAFKIAFEREDLEVVAVNDLSDTSTLAHLLSHDSNYGAYQHPVESDESNLVVNDKNIKVLAEKEPTSLPWRDLGVDIVIEATGLFTDPQKAKAHIEAGAKKVIITAPAKGDGADTIVIGVNEDKLAETGDIISNASCTTNCIAPVAAILNNNFGIEKAMMTTVHSYTASQRLQDAPAKDLREARSAAINIVPTSTGASIAAAKALPALEGIFGGLSVRVPTPVVSLSDFAVVTKKDVTVEEINDVFRKAAQDPYYQGILTATEDELVSTDYIGNSHSAIVDLKLTNVVGGNLVKVIAWYDNEWGYCNRLIELTADVAKIISGQPQTEDQSEKNENQQQAAEPSDDITALEKDAPIEAKIEVSDLSDLSTGSAKEEQDIDENKQPVHQSKAQEGKPYTIIESPDQSLVTQPPEKVSEKTKEEEDLLLGPLPKNDSKEESKPHKHQQKHEKHKLLEEKSEKEPESLEGPNDEHSQHSKFHHF